MIKFLKITFLLMFISVSMILTQAFAEAGKATYVLGKAEIRDSSGDVTRLRKKDVVNTGDTIMTSKNGQAMILMLDESKITIRPSTEFVIDEYYFNKNIEKDKSNYELVKGGFRSVTGIMGKKDKGSFKLKTNIATMGIRGTDFDLSYCETDCIDNEGLFVNVVSGGVSLTNDGGTMDIDVGDIGHVSDINESPKFVEELPKNMRIGKKGRSNEDSDTYPSHEEEMVAIALNSDPSETVINELVDADFPTRDIVKGAVSVGMEATDVVETLINIDPDNTDEIIEQSIDAIPELAGDFTTMGVVLGDLSEKSLKKIQAKKGVDPKAIQSGESLGRLISPRKGKKEKRLDKDNKKGEENKVNANTSPDKPENRAKPKGVPFIEKELLPGTGSGGGSPPSAS